MKKLTCQILAASAILFCLVSAKAATVTVTVADDAIPANDGAVGTFYWALTNAQAGDTIAFNIPGAGPHFLQVPTNGFPLIYQKHGLTIDGYTQPGSLANTNPITGSNSAQLKIVIDGRNGNGRDMNIFKYDGTLAKSDPPIDNTPMALEGNQVQSFALLAVYRSTNVTIKGLAFLPDNIDGYIVTGKGVVSCIYLAHDYGLVTNIWDGLEYDAGSVRNCHVAGCWFGVNPTNVTKSGVVWGVAGITFPRYAGDDKWAPDVSGRPNIPNVGLTIGVAAGSANPRAEFNVFVGQFYAFNGEGMRLRVSGNFSWFLPDGVTPLDISQHPLYKGLWNVNVAAQGACARFGEIYASSSVDAKPIVIGTDGDGVNDADEGNLWGPIGGLVNYLQFGSREPTVIDWFRSGSNTFLIAGNRWGINNNGTQLSNSAAFISGLYLDDQREGNSKVFFGSDFATNRSAATIAAQANHFYNNWPIGIFGNPPKAVNAKLVPSLYTLEYPRVENVTNTLAYAETQSWYIDTIATNAYWFTTNALGQHFDTTFASVKACVSVRGNVLVGNGLTPFNYATNAAAGTNSLPLLRVFTNFFGVYTATNVPIIPAVNAGSSDGTHLVGTFAPGVGDYTNIIIDVYESDPYGWTNGQKFVMQVLTNATSTNGFPQGKRYIGSQSVPNSGSFNVSLAGMLTLASPDVTITANYSKAPAGTPWAETTTSDFSMPITVRPVITATKSGSNLNLSWEPAGVMYTVQTNASVVSAGTWGNHTAGPVSPPVSVPIGTGTKFFRLKQ